MDLKQARRYYFAAVSSSLPLANERQFVCPTVQLRVTATRRKKKSSCQKCRKVEREPPLTD
jgi:hypothetical protein